MKCHKSDVDSVKKCVDALKNGHVVIIPTDTVYGFSGIVDHEHKTDEKIRAIKGRSEDKPFIQLIGNPNDIFKYTDDKISDSLLKLWPGPLTIIVNNKTKNGTVAFRCPDDDWLRKILNSLDHPLYSTSANRSGSPILEKFNELEKEFSQEVELLVDDGDRIGGAASTIVKIEADSIKVIRQGELKVDQLF